MTIDQGKLDAWTKRKQWAKDQSIAKANLARASNRSRASGQRRAKRTLLGGSAINVAEANQPRSSATYQGRRQASHSRVPQAWSDRIGKAQPTVRYSAEYLAQLSWVKAYYNPNPVVPNRSSVKVREYSERLGAVITKRKIVDHGGFRQEPADTYVMRGEPCLFDECRAMPRLGQGRYWVPKPIPAYRVPVLPDDGKRERDALVAAWRTNNDTIQPCAR